MASKGKRKPKLRDYSSRITLTYEESAALREMLLEVEENSITTAIIGAVMVEYQLDTLLRRRFKRNDDDTWEQIVSDRGFLSSFSSKIVAGYAFGIYDKKVRDNLDTIRNIRNAFAHSRKLIDFDDELIRAELLKANFSPKRFKRYVAESTNARIAKSAYITLCQDTTIKLLKRHARALKASTKRNLQKIRESPVAAALGYGLGTTNYLAGLQPFLLPSAASHSDDPKRAALLQRLGKLFPESPKTDDNKGK